MFGFLIFLGLITPLVFIHELGHYLVAKKVGVGVESFSIGFGPVLLKRKMWNTEWRISLIPLGGYVKLRGELEYDDNDPSSFWSTTPLQRVYIALGGPLMNFILPVFIFTALALASDPIDVTGINPEAVMKQSTSLKDATSASLKHTKNSIIMMTDGLSDLVTGIAPISSLGGPLFIFDLAEEMINSWFSFFEWMALLSLNLGIMNLLPVPVLDGGLIVVSGYEIATKRRISMKARKRVLTTGMYLVLALLVTSTYNDIIRMFF